MPELEHDNPHQTEAEVQEDDTTPAPKCATLEARNGRAAFMVGFGHGATHRAQCPKHMGHATLAVDYVCGYQSGINARGRASAAASERYGFTPSMRKLKPVAILDPVP